LLVVLTGITAAGWAQPKPKPKMPKTPVQLELTAEVATTTDDGYPSSLRVTIRNVGGVTVDMPVLAGSCHPDNGIQVQEGWESFEHPGSGFGGGSGCGMGDVPTLMDRIRCEWVRLRPGESMTETARIHRSVMEQGPGTVTYWVEYTPPDATPAEVETLMQAGTYIPTEKLETPHESFEVH
jgi:hypothetical protein